MNDWKDRLEKIEKLRDALRQKLRFCAADVGVAQKFAPARLAKLRAIRREVNSALNTLDVEYASLPSGKEAMVMRLCSAEHIEIVQKATEVHQKY